MKFIVFIYIFSMSIFSHGFNSVDKMEYLLKQKILLDKNVIIPKKNEEILRPANAWIPVMIFKDFCLFYKVPNKDLGGVLAFVKKSNECRNEYDENVLAKMDEVSSLFIKSNKKIEISFLKNEKKYNLLFDFFGLDDEHLVFLLNQNEKINSKLESNAICRSFNDNCEMDKNSCFRCPGAWFEIIQKKCPTKKIRKCGLNNCGSKGENACAYGRGICAKGLKSQWSDRGTLVCL